MKRFSPLKIHKFTHKVFLCLQKKLQFKMHSDKTLLCSAQEGLLNLRLETKKTPAANFFSKKIFDKKKIFRQAKIYGGMATRAKHKYEVADPRWLRD